MAKFLRYEPCPKCRERGHDRRGDNLAVYGDDSAHCFSCHYHVPPPTAVRWEVKDEDKEAKIKRIIPDDFSKEVPAHAWQWLLQYGLPYSYWQPIVGWSDKYQRLVFKVGEPTVFSIGRLLPKADEHYGPDRKWFVWGDAHRHCEVLGPNSDSITLVEDLISAHKVSQVRQAIPLFGTQVFKDVIYYLTQQGKPINLWLDKDQESTIYKKANTLSVITSCPVNVTISTKDPKELSYDAIREVIRN